MWIKNLTVFLGSETFDWSAAELEERLDAHRCPPCGRQSPSSEGFVPPLKNDERMVVAAGSYFYLVHQEIIRLLPGPVVKEELDARVEEIREREGRPVGRKERSELKDQITFELLPQAFTRSRRTGVLIDPQRRRVMVEHQTGAHMVHMVFGAEMTIMSIVDIFSSAINRLNPNL